MRIGEGGRSSELRAEVAFHTSKAVAPRLRNTLPLSLCSLDSAVDVFKKTLKDLVKVSLLCASRLEVFL